jgi:glycerol-3-phosphate acyltransferase PlsX
MRIVLDAMGSDTCPAPEVHAALSAARTFGDPILLVGPEDLLRPQLIALGGESAVAPGGPVQLLPAADRLTMEDKGLALALKAKRPTSQTSMAIGMDAVKSGAADAFVTAGNTGGALATAFFRLGVIPGVERPALTGLFPVRGGHCVVLDIGANPEVKPEVLVQFAVMGSLYAAKLRGIANPRVGLLSNGEEEKKGNQLVQAAYPLLKAAGLNFVGNVEAKELFAGGVDVVVTDGFTGNILLKSSESVAKFITDTLKTELMRSTRTKLGALLAKPAFAAIKQIMDPGEIGAAPLLGVNGLVFIGHGRSDERALVSAIRTARQAVATDLRQEIQAAIAAQLAAAPSATLLETP